MDIQYSVMQSDGNSFGGNVVSGSLTRTLLDEYNILNQIYDIKYVRIIIMMFLIRYNIIRKYILTLQYPLCPWVPCPYVLYFFKYAFSLISLKI